MMKAIAWMIMALVALTLPAQADVLLVDSIAATPANTAAGVPRPGRGISMAQVRAAYGEPQRVLDAVGEPPISRWVYPSYTVYFEHDKVIDSVVHR